MGPTHIKKMPKTRREAPGRNKWAPLGTPLGPRGGNMAPEMAPPTMNFSHPYSKISLESLVPMANCGRPGEGGYGPHMVFLSPNLWASQIFSHRNKESFPSSWGGGIHGDLRPSNHTIIKCSRTQTFPRIRKGVLPMSPGGGMRVRQPES